MVMGHEPGALPHSYWVVENGQAELTDGAVIEEALVSIYVNGQDLADLMCSPIDQEALALGFLYNEQVIQSIDEVALIRPNVSRTVIDIFLDRTEFDPPRRMVLTSGCGGGITFQHLADSHPPLETHFTTTPAVILDRMQDLRGAARLYNQVRGVHTSILANTEGLLVSAEDVGRHNTVDKIAGKALQAHIDTRNCILLSSGRISSEMLGKARRMGIPVVASRTAPTSISVQLGQVWNICIVGYVRQGSMRIYTHPYRLGLPSAERIVETT
jgi:FdhD protein